MKKPDGQEGKQPPYQEDGAAWMMLQALVLDSQSNAEQKRENGERLEIDQNLQACVHKACETTIRRRCDESLKDRDAELGLKVDSQYTEQSQSAKGVQPVNALVRR
jgi:hypothetical protein